MSKDPAILFYTSDFLSGTSFFNDEQRGQYIKLLCEQHQNGHIPEQHMIDICKTYDSPVLKKFKKDEEGNYYQERMELEIKKRISYSESRRNNRFSKKESEHMSNHMNEHMSPHMENENGNDNKDIIISSGKESEKNHQQERELFNIFRKDYPGIKRGNDTEFDNFVKKTKDWEDVLPLLSIRLKYQTESRQILKENKRFVPEWKNLETWINKRGWEIQIKTEE